MMRPDPTPRPHAFAGGVPPGTAWALVSDAFRPLRWIAGGSMMTAALLVSAMVWLPLGEGDAEALSASPEGGLTRLSTPAPPAPPALPEGLERALPAAPMQAVVQTLEAQAAPAAVAPEAGPALERESALRGVASYYAAKFEGRRTASGEPYRGSAMTAAHRTLPFGTRVRVTNPRNGRSVIVKINDRGPFHPRRVIDVSRTAAIELGILRRGRDAVELEILGR